MTGNGYDGSVPLRYSRNIERMYFSRNRHVQVSKTSLAFSPRIFTVAQGDFVGQVARIDAVSGEKGFVI